MTNHNRFPIMERISPDQAAQRIREAGIIAIARGDFTPPKACAIADALARGGVRVMEVTLGSETSVACIEALREHTDGRMLVGAGTVRTPEGVDRALGAGAEFLVSPNTDPESIERSRAAGALHLPGVFTASEAQAAIRAGCRMQKLFPASHMGPSYMKALRAPLSDVEFVPTGGIDIDNMAAFIDAGAVALGVGSAIIPGPNPDPHEVETRAERMTATLEEARAQRPQ